uniref:Protein NUCLEAR FUSION DEFECTIVE 4-like n=1 Tax=Cucumis melo TaxID=3656 RepID=A0A9I9CKD3_CUCME
MIVAAGQRSNGGIRSGELADFIGQVVVGRWFSLFASFLVMTGAGGVYLFAYYSRDIKTTLQCDQTTLNRIGFYKDLGSNVGVIAGLLAEVAPTWLVLLIGAAFNFIGYFKIWQAVTGKIVRPTVAFFCFYIMIGANSQNFANTGVLVTCVKNFPERRGVMLGLLKGFVGLSGAIMTQLYIAIYGHDTKSLILLIAWFPSIVSLIFVYTIREIKFVKHPNEFRVFVQFLCVTVLLALLLTALIFVQKRVHFDQSAHIAIVAAILALLFVPLLIAIREEVVIWNLNKRTPISNPFIRIGIESSQPKPPIHSPSTPQHPLQTQPTSCFSNIFNKPERGEDYTVLQAIFSIDMLIICSTMLIGVGASLTAIDNLGQIGEAQGYPSETINLFVSLISISNFTGRIFSGFVSEILLEKFQFPRPLMLTLILLISSLGHLLVAFPFDDSLYLASIIIGFSMGSQVPLHFAMISEIFGLKHYSTLFNFGQLSCPIGSYILNVMVTGKLYDEVARIGSNPNKSHCVGTHCYEQSFLILAGLTFIVAMISLILVQRTREFYRGDIYKKFKEDMETLKTEVEFYRVDEKRTRIGNLLVDKHSINFKK